MSDYENSVTLKWGTLKGWNFEGEERAAPLLREYHEIGSSLSAIVQRDTPRQKEIILALIDLCEDGDIYLDWDGRYVTKQEARDYVMNYGLEKTPALRSRTQGEGKR